MAASTRNTKLVSLFLLSLLIFSMLSTEVMGRRRNGRKRYGPGSLTPAQCYPECVRRCGNTQYHKPCMFFCQKCCHKCLCVPPGYYGNKQVCGSCYNNWKTKRGGPKCP